MSNKYYPIYLDLVSRHCVVIGGNDEAARKAQGLIDCQAHVTVISPSLVKSLHSLVEMDAVTWVQRPYAVGDLSGANLVIVADSGNMEINKQVIAEEYYCELFKAVFVAQLGSNSTYSPWMENFGLFI